MRSLIFIAVLVALSGCYTKKRALEKFCRPVTFDSTIVLHDTVVVDSITRDTVFHASIDTVVLTKDKLTISYIRVRDSVYLFGKYAGDTIVRHDTVKVTIPFTCPKADLPTLWDHVQALWWALLLAFMAGVLVWGRLSRQSV